MDVDMDIDMDLDLGPDPETARLEEEAMRIDSNSTPQPNGGFYPPTFNVPPDEQELAPTKVHLRGTESLSTADIERWISENFPEPARERIEWVDDSSLNINYANSDMALQALNAFTFADGFDPNTIPVSQLRNAKRLSTHPDVGLAVRQAFVTDRKQRNARLASRFYLMNPDKAPNEDRIRSRDRRERRRRYSDEGDDYSRRRFDDREHRRRRGQEDFDVNMYDDDAGQGSRPSRRRGSLSGYSSSEDGRRRRGPRGRGRAHDDLFSTRPGRGDGRLRDRSASPRGEGDGRHGFTEAEFALEEATPELEPEPEVVAWSSSNIGKELFPHAPHASALSPSPQPKELFPNRQSRRSRELFPHKTAISNHRRSDALDVDETHHLLHIGIAHAPTAGGGRDATARMLEGGDPGPWDTGYQIRGMAAAQQEEGPGFSIRGAAGQDGGAVKELFPLKTGGNLGRELFADKMGSGNNGRRKGDMYY